MAIKQITDSNGAVHDIHAYADENGKNFVTGYMDLASAQTASGIKTFNNGINIGSAKLTYDSTNSALVISF